MSQGKLYHIDVATKRVTLVDLGGELVERADGLIASGDTLFVICQGPKLAVAIAMGQDWKSGKVLRRLEISGSETPATAGIAGGHIYVVDPQFNRLETKNPVAPFRLYRRPLTDFTAAE